MDKLTVEEMPASSRRYPFVGFKMDRECGKEILAVENLSKTVDGRKVLDNVSLRVNRGEKIAFVGEDEIAKTTLFKIVMGEMEPCLLYTSKTMPGLASAAAAALDSMDIAYMVGSLAGDDTAFLLMRDTDSAAAFCDEIKEML